MQVPSPQALGMPPRVAQWRPKQETGLGVMITSATRTKVICAPTGSGKTDMAVGAGKHSQVPTCIVTNSRGLQDQYVSQHPDIVDLRGRSNYPCQMREDFSCEEGYAASCTYKGSVMCPSSAAEIRAATSSLVVTNYDKWTTSKKFGIGMAHFEHVIFDEGHEAVDAVGRAMQVILSHKEIEEDLSLKMPKGIDSEDLVVWREWARTARETAEQAQMAARARITGVQNPKPSWVKHYTHMRNLSRRLAIVATVRPDSWVVDGVKDEDGLREGFQFDPIWPGKYTESSLLFGIPNVSFLSATIRPKTMAMLGIAKDTYTFHELDSDFDPSRCPIYYIPTKRVDSRDPDNTMLWVLLDQIAARRQDRKGMVQTISFPRQKEIMEFSRFRERFVINEKGEPPTEKIEEFRQSGPGSILVSPSVGQGYDFAHDLCRWQFVCKIPFDPPSKIQKARQAVDKEYGFYRAWQKLVQMFGRDMRAQNDWSERFIGDSHYDWFRRYSHLAPRSFHMFFREIQILPPPPPLNRV